MPRTTPLADRFWPRVNKTPSCWFWTGTQTLGYGYINSDGGRSGQNMRAHRVAWILTRGPIPKGMCVLHTCDQKLCVNPAHLELGSHAKNSRDAVLRGLINTRTQRRPGAQNGRAKITEADVRIIRAAYAERRSGKYVKRGTCQALADRFGIDPEVIRRIADRKLWAHVE